MEERAKRKSGGPGGVVGADITETSICCTEGEVAKKDDGGHLSVLGHALTFASDKNTHLCKLFPETTFCETT